MKKSLILSFVLLLAFSFVLTGCGKSVGDIAAEKSIENAIGGDADVNIEDGSVNIETDQGTWQAGEGSSLPEDWPDDVYVPDGKIVTSSNNQFSMGVSLEVDQSVSDLEEKYKSEIEESDWDINMEFAVSGNVMLGANKDGKSLSVSISDEEGKTMIVITITDQL